MAGLALGLCGGFNGVSRVHQQVTQRMFQPWFARWPVDDIPAGCVTNGVHTPSWDGPESDAVWTKACGKERWRYPLPGACPLKPLADEELWAMRRAQRARLVQYLNQRSVQPLLDPETLTLGFARRFTAYKRPDLPLFQPDRLARIITNRDRPVQIVLAGKAHPQDEEGKAMIAR
jgi:starch phosphorylase